MSTLNAAPQFPPVAALVPHADAMCLLDTVLSADAERVVCHATVRPDAVFATADGRVPTWVGAEYLAQAAAVWGGLQRWRSASAGAGGAATQGYLTGVRELTCHVADFRLGQRLEVRLARGFAMGDAAIWEGEILDVASGAPLVAGSLSLFVAEPAADAEPAARTASTPAHDATGDRP